MRFNKLLGKMNFIIILILILISLQDPLRQTSIVFAEEKKLIDYTNIENNNEFKNFNIGNSIKLKGVFDSYNWYFSVNRWWDIENIDLNIFYSVNTIIDSGKNAFITLSLNGESFYTKRINYDLSIEEQSIKITLPKKLVKVGVNELKVQSYCKVLDGNVQVMDNVSWMTILSDSTIKAKFKDKEITDTIEQFPYPFYKVNESSISNCYILIPDEYNDTEITAALFLSAYFGSLGSTSEYKVNINRCSDFVDKQDKDIIYIGSYSNMPNELKQLHSIPNQMDLKKTAILQKGNSPYSKGIGSNRKVLMIISDNDNLKLKSVRALMNNELVSKMHSDKYLISNESEVEYNNVDFTKEKISNDSNIMNRILKKLLSYKFDNYPAPFVVENRFNNTALVVSDKLSKEELNSLSYMISHLASGTKINGDNFRVIKASNFNDIYKDMNLIVYGTCKDNKLIMDLNKNLWFKYDLGYDKFQSNEKLELTNERASNIVAFQFDKSPFNKRCAILIMTSPNKNILKNSLIYLSSSGLSSRLTGDSVIIDKFGNVQTFRFKGNLTENIYTKLISLDKHLKGYLLLIIFIFIGSIIMLIVYFLRKLSRNSGKLI